MNLADLVRGKKTTGTTRPATAIPAILARVATNQAENKLRIATIATIAIATPMTDDIFAPDYPDSENPAADGHTLPLYCESGDCHCSQKLPAADYPKGCGGCEYLNNPRQAKEQTETTPATFEQTGDPVTCPYWFQVCHAVDFYRDACTSCTDCQIFKFLKVNT